VGRIDRADIDSINFTGSVMDLLFYALILWAGLLLWERLSERRRRAAQEDLVAHAVQYRLAALTQPNSPQDHRQSQYLHADKRNS
jgi:hypothetical protein